MANLLYRPAELSDIPEMARLRSLKRGTKDYWAYRISAYFERELNPQLALPPRAGFVAMEGETMAGFIVGHLSRRYSCDGEVQWIYVDPNRRGGGIATELIRLQAKWFIEQKAFKICVDVDPSNVAAHRLYKRLGAVDLNPHYLVWNDIRYLAQESDTMDANS